MPIEVTARLMRDIAVFFAGEDIHCKNTDNRKQESLAWCSVQVQCERIVDPGLKHAIADAPGTSISRSAHTVFSCRPVVLFCDLLLAPRETRHFHCTQQLPSHEIPPSFRGHFIRYQYRLTVGVQHVNSPIRLVHMPLRVLHVERGLQRGEDGERARGDNPFLLEECASPSILDLATNVIETLTMSRGATQYTMKSDRGRLAHLTLFKRVFKLGDDVVGRFVFVDCDVPCIQYSVSLQSVEITEEPGSTREWISTVATEHCVAAFHRESCFRMNIPLSSTPTFHTDSVHLRWRLHFEFVAGTTALFPSPTPGVLTRAPTTCAIESTAWNIDIKLLPCTPFNVALTAVNLEPVVMLTV